jgi:hypothetical protein
MEIKGWLVNASDDGRYLYIERDNCAGQIHVKADDEGYVVDLYNDNLDPDCCASVYALYTELERE